MSDTQLRVFTLNCWGLKYVSKNRSERISAIMSFLAQSDYDVVALQELWVYSDYEKVRSSVAKILPYSKFFYSGALGAGLAILTRFPIIGATVHPYSLNGSPRDVVGGDWFVGKAATSVLITHPVLGQVQVFNTHLFAKGGEGGPEHHRAHRLVNAWEFAKLAKQSAELGRYVIAAGDFNSIPTTLPMAVIREHAALEDAWAVTHPNPPSSSSVPSPYYAVQTHGVTADSPLNSYSAGKPLDVYARSAQGKRLDYVLYRDPHDPQSPSATPNSRPRLLCANTRVMLTETVPGRSFSYSDHFGLEATLLIEHPEAQELTLPSDLSAFSSMPSVLSVPAPSALPTQLSPAAVTAILQALTTCYRYSRVRSQQELLVFVICVVLLLAFIISAAWLPHAAYAPLFAFGAALVTWLGTTMLYIGFVYGRWEVNALMNVIEELELYRLGFDTSAVQNGE
ncbi:hypothetical protein EW146_g866 [Bondarzewia mesenterica]|uniref:Endonuclease/exonuclease/phosphatase domain-containing protein n=1 Tax=Bondarzewia mesenterica TaxID=1095465 RepID=A0A4S4M7H5_9AGAM|nr:hypothetical protein EW146_g866 [Bondarzewia mesenterica]